MTWSFSVSPAIVVLALLVWLASGWLCWANWRRRRTRGAMAMEGLRFLTVTLIAFTLLRPEVARRIIRTEPSTIVVLHDHSASMQTRDLVTGNSNIMRRQDWVDQSLATNFARPLAARASVSLQDFGRAPTNTPSADSGTDLDAALEGVLQREKHLKAVLLLSDGDWNQGRSPLSAATAFRSRRVPVYSVGVGSETALPDLSLEGVSAPSYGLYGEQISIPFRLRSSLSREIKTTVVLSGSKGAEARKEIVIPPHGQVQDSVIWSPQALGEHVLKLKLPVETDEYLADNNEQNFRIAIRTEKLNVLVVDSLPRWEYRYLRNALSRDPGINMDCLLYHPGMGPGKGSNYLDAFPSTREQLAKYDVVFLGDVGLGDNELSAADAERVKGLVEQQGSGVVFLPGARGRQLTFLNTPLNDLLPVAYDEARPQGVTGPNEANLILTSPGRVHFLTKLANEENENAEIWKTLPGFFWCSAVLKSRPGAQVLAVHSNLRAAAGRMPLLVTRDAGAGEVLFMGTDSAWRWRRGVEDKYHYRFWGQVVRWMSHKRHMAKGEGLRLAFSPETPQTGESLLLQATVLDIAAKADAQLSGRVLSPSGKSERLQFAPVPGGWGVYQAGFVPREGGTYRVTLSAAQGPARLDTEIVIRQPPREKLGQPANLAILREISDLTQGASGNFTELDRIVHQISILPEPEPLQARLQLWANPWWGGFLLALLAIYWTARKVAGMI